ncbi:MAG: hypothetical protein AB7U51_05430 [Arcobacter sp.]|uniref:hypothetical protein n=1 Tax=Arcobacter sp. TaxID=1872629 RepID=UPI003D0468A5
MIDIEEIIEKINYLIESNNILVKKGSSDSLAIKYFYITKDMSHYIKSLVHYNENSFLASMQAKKSIKVIDLFAGSGIFTLIFSKYLLEIALENKIRIDNFLIILNDKMYNKAEIDKNSIKKNFLEITNNLRDVNFINIFGYDLSIRNDISFQEYINESHLNIAIANPMFLSISKGKEHYKPIVFPNEDIFLQNEGIKQLITNFFPKIDYFLYLTKLETLLKLESHKNKITYKNDYSNLTITETDKQRYEIFQDSLDELEKIKNEDFWKFTNSQKENFNTITLFKKGNSKESECLYVYKNILDDVDKMLLEDKIEKIKKFLENITLENTVKKYEELKDLL